MFLQQNKSSEFEGNSCQITCPLSAELRDVTSLFGALTDIQVSTFLGSAKQRLYTAGERVFNQGDLPKGLYIVVTGRVDLVVRKNGVYSLEASYQAGDSLGETALIGIQPQVGSAIVVGDDVELLEISRDAFSELYETDIELYGLVMMNIARELSRKLHGIMKSV